MQYVLDVAITLTVQTQQVDPITRTYQTETKALLNVSPRNVFNTWMMAGYGETNRQQATPAVGHRPPAMTILCRIGGQAERGMAMVLTLFLTSALTVLAASLMFLSQTETYASMNYRMMTLARYGAEAGVEKAATFLYDESKYVKPSTTGADLLSSYDRTTSPVTYNGQPVVLSAMNNVTSNYPVPSVITAFQNAAKGSLSAGNISVGYAATATLILMQTFDPYGGGAGAAPGVVQTWQITSDGTLGGSKSAVVEVVTIAEQPVWPRARTPRLPPPISAAPSTFTATSRSTATIRPG
jgi:Tfp pilus assembly protein PilX